MGDGLSFVLNGGDGADNQTDPDVLEAATADAIPALLYGDGSLAGVHVEVSNWKVVFLAFGIEGIADGADRTEVMDRCLDWLIGDGTTAVGEAPPRAATLTPNRPNPFNPSTTLAYEVSTPGPVRLQVYDLRGRLVATLVDGHVAAGRHAARWSGRDGNGRDVSSGVYVARLLAGERIARQSMVLAR